MIIEIILDTEICGMLVASWDVEGDEWVIADEIGSALGDLAINRGGR